MPRPRTGQGYHFGGRKAQHLADRLKEWKAHNERTGKATAKPEQQPD